QGEEEEISMIDAILGSGSQQQEVYEAENKDSLGKDDFLKIFMAQLQHQDPLNPMEGTEFTSQLAQFSSLEQLYNVNQNLESLKEVQEGNGKFESLNLIGKEIAAEGDTISLGEGTTTKAAFKIGEEADCTALIYDSDGNLVRKISLGVLEAGNQELEWDGVGDAGVNMAAGMYGFEVVAIGKNGETVAADTMISGRVERVSLGGSSPTVYVGAIPISFSQIRDVQVPQATALSGTGDGMEDAFQAGLP
ncbi:MAG: flagellar hook capping FlgD N-terminal domain-containing protein, partial [Deltaproteobacteria bacterium]